MVSRFRLVFLHKDKEFFLIIELVFKKSYTFALTSALVFAQTCHKVKIFGLLSVLFVMSGADFLVGNVYGAKLHGYGDLGNYGQPSTDLTLWFFR